MDEEIKTVVLRDLWSNDILLIICIIIFMGILVYLVFEEISHNVKSKQINILMLKWESCPACQKILTIFNHLNDSHPGWINLIIMDVSDFYNSLHKENDFIPNNLALPLIMLEIDGKYRKIDNVKLIDELKSLVDTNIKT